MLQKNTFFNTLHFDTLNLKFKSYFVERCQFSGFQHDLACNKWLKALMLKTLHLLVGDPVLLGSNQQS